MQVLGDATVRRFLVRDLDSWLLPCGRAAVTQWEESEAMFHVMRDHPAHYGQMLAGLWGGHNYHNLSLAAQLSRALFFRPATRRGTARWSPSPPGGRGLLDRQRPRPRQEATGDGGWDVSSAVQASAAQGRVDQLLIQWIFKMLLCL